MKRYRGDGVIVFFILLLLVISYCFFYTNKPVNSARQIVILQNGIVIKTIYLPQRSKEEMVLSDGAKENVLLVENDRVQITSANCPDQLCKKFGWIQAVGQQIACIPHRLLIRIEGQDGLDGILY